MKILLFGTGDYYFKYKKWFRKNDIVALIDNNPNKTGTYLDDCIIYNPEEAVKLEYDVIVILSVHEIAMRKQLIGLGVESNRILGYSELVMHPELCTSLKPIDFYAMDNTFYGFLNGKVEDYILVMSHNLDLNGASLALFYAAKLLKQNGYKMIFASWNDGKLREYLADEGIPTVVDCNLEIKTASSINWIRPFNKIICNTLNYYQFLSDRRLSDKVIWWLHDPVMFYETINKDLLRQIDATNLWVVAVGPISEAAIKEYRPDIKVGQLLYGIPEYDISANRIENEKLELVTIGNVQEYKGQDILIDALTKLSREEKQKVHLKIVGSQDSAFADSVKKAAQGLEDTVEFIPPKDREAVHKILDFADVLVCPSRVDTMSVSSNEAMQHSIPCIVSDSVGIASYIHDNFNGLVFKCGDSDSLAGKIRWCIENRNELETMGKASRKIYEDYFSMEVFEKNLLKIVDHFYEH